MSFPMEAANQHLLIEGAKTFGIHLDEIAVGAFDLYLHELLKWNQKINLTAIRTEKGIVLKHFLDSLSAHLYLPKHPTILDIGSGAGFPGIPLKIIQPISEMTLIDSVRKKVDFQKHIIRMLGLKGMETIHGRVQDKEICQILGGCFDVVLSRAFSDLQTFLVLSLPFLKPRGCAIAMRGNMEDSEIRCLNETKGLHYRLREVSHFTLPFSTFKRTILLFEKE